MLAIASLAVIGLIVAYHARSKPSVVLSIALGLLLGGAIGNLIDRIRYGYVVDFVDAGDRRPPVLHVQRGGQRDQRRHPPAHPARAVPGAWRIGRTAPMAERSGGTAVGVRTVRVPDGGRGRADRIVADATGFSRSYVQKLISGGRLTPAAAAARQRGRGRGHGAAPRRPARRAARAGARAGDRADRGVRGRRPVDRRQARRPRRPSVARHATGTVVNALLGRAGGAEYGGIAGVQRPGIVHRLDRDTSGC